MGSITIYNHDINHCQSIDVPGGEFYSGRAVGISRPDDIVQLHPGMRTLWPCLTAHYRNIGLEHTQNPVWDNSFDFLRGRTSGHISLFLFSDALNARSDDGKWLRKLDPLMEETVAFINSKNNFVSVAQKMGLRVPCTLTFDGKSDPAPADSGFPCFLKLAISASGCGIYRCETSGELDAALGRVPDGTPFQIQEEVAANLFLNLQYQGTRGQAERFAATRQILAGFAHVGSEFPADNPPWKLFDPLADWLVKRGLKGFFAFDLAVTGSGRSPGYLALECNPRFNGATYPALISRKLGIRAWSCETFRTGAGHLEEIDLTGIEFDSLTREGAVLVNWGTILAGRLGILLAGPEDRRERLRGQLEERLA